MKRSVVYLVFVMMLSVSALSQRNASRPALPADLTKYVGRYPMALMKVPSVRARLRTLLGKQYTEFDNSINVQHQITRFGSFILASGCMAHLCGDNAAAFAIDLKNKRIHAVIFEKDEAPRYFNEDKAPTPSVLLNWIGELEKY